MSTVSPTVASVNQHTTLHFINGTDTHSSYAVVARRGNIFLGVRISGLSDGKRFGVPGKTYLHARIRSARSQVLANQLNGDPAGGNIVSLSDHQMALNEAWPNLSFEKVDTDRASVEVGVFIGGSLTRDTTAVVTRIEEGASSTSWSTT